MSRNSAAAATQRRRIVYFETKIRSRPQVKDEEDAKEWAGEGEKKRDGDGE